MRKTLVIGIGAGGIHSIDYANQQGIEDVDFVALSTDQQELDNTDVAKKLLLGKISSNGAGGQPNIGWNAALEDRPEIERILEGYESIIIISGMGGGTGTGVAPVVAKIAKNQKSIVRGIVTRPFLFEGKRRRLNAERGIKELGEICDSLFIVSNQSLLELYPDMGIKASFEAVDQLVGQMIKKKHLMFRENNIVELAAEDIRAVLTTEENNPDIFPITIEREAVLSGKLLQEIEMLTRALNGSPDKELFRWTMENEGDPLIIVARERDRLVGFSMGYRRNEHTYYSWLDDILEEYRDRGVAEGLIEQQHQWCQKKGYKEIETDVTNRRKDKLILHLQLGFDIAGIRFSRERGEKIVLIKKL